MLNLNALKNYSYDYGITLTENELKKFEQFYNLVVETNKNFNLTAITSEEDFINKHIIDSILSINHIPTNVSLLDIGSGAGFPAIPIAITRPDVIVTALDSTAKKMDFINQSASILGLKNISTIAGRAEDQKNKFNSFDIVTARAVASLNILLELAMPLLKNKGLFIAYKADDSELNNIRNAQKELHCTLVKNIKLELPNGDNRALLIFMKDNPTPTQYPRQYGTIKKHPL